MSIATTASPRICPHCGERLPPLVSTRTLAAARVIRDAPDMRGTSADVVAALGVSARQAATLLSRARAAGLVRLVGTTAGAGGKHGGARRNLYEADARVVDAY